MGELSTPSWRYIATSDNSKNWRESHYPQVYGTTNIRVADTSIIPLHIVAHTQGEFPDFARKTCLAYDRFIEAIAYAIGEQGIVQQPSHV